MKQNMQSRASIQGTVFASGLVSTTKGTTIAFELFRCDKQFLTQRSMKQQENDLDKGPLTVYGLNRKSYSQSVLPGYNRTPVEPNVKGHQWIMSTTGFSFISWCNAVAEYLSHGRYRAYHKTFAGNPNMLNLYQEIKPDGFNEGVAAIDSQIRTIGLPTYPIRAVLLHLPEDLVPTKPDNGSVRMNFIADINPSSRTVSHFPELILVPYCFGNLPLSFLFQWRKNMRLKQLAELIIRQVYFAKTSIKIIQPIDLQLILN